MFEQTRLLTHPYIAVFGDDKDNTFTAKISSCLPDEDIPVLPFANEDALLAAAPDALIVLVLVTDDNADALADLAHQLNNHERVVCSVIAIARNLGYGRRLEVMANGFDTIFKEELIEEASFRQILINKITKGKTRLYNRHQGDDYRKFKAALSVSPGAILLFDENKKLFYASPHYWKAYPDIADKFVYGLDYMDMFTLLCKEQNLGSHDPRYQAIEEWWKSMSGKIEFETNDKRWWRTSARHLPGEKAIVVTTTDITNYVMQQKALKAQQEATAQALAKEQEASAIQKQFVTMVSHEFRTPLSIIDGHAQAFIRRVESLSHEEIRKKAKSIRSAVSRLITLMEGVLSSNMLKTGKLDLVPEKMDIAQLIGDLCEDHRELATRQKIELSLENVPKAVEMDKKVVTLILSNILGNGIKFSPEDATVTVRCTWNHNYIRLAVQDQGIGIPPDELERVFERYYRASTSSGIPGTGIGLNLVRDLVQLAEGKIKIESPPGQGTCVTVTLPAPKAR